jgi:hypothetical protein
MAGVAPPWIDAVRTLDDRDRYAAMTPEQRLAIFEDVCALACTILEAHPERTRILADNEPMPAAAAAVWRRLVRQARDAGAAS